MGSEAESPPAPFTGGRWGDSQQGEGGGGAKGAGQRLRTSWRLGAFGRRESARFPRSSFLSSGLPNSAQDSSYFAEGLTVKTKPGFHISSLEKMFSQLEKSWPRKSVGRRFLVKKANKEGKRPLTAW